VENVARFFKERGVNVAIRGTSPPVPKPVVSAPRPPAQGGLFGTVTPISPAPAPARTPLPKAPPPPKQPARTGTVVEHPKYGTGTVVRREGEGDDAKVVVIFQRYGMKKLVEKYAGLTKA
jgi:DNA helicase-2/ATP-dependent DNA helicase PcrA